MKVSPRPAPLTSRCLALTLCGFMVALCASRTAVAEDAESESKAYRFTREATYLYTDFLEGDDATTLGIETDASFGLGDLHGRHIMYIEAMDYPRAIPGKRGAVPDEEPELFEEATGIGDLLTGVWLSSPAHGHQALEVGYGLGMQLPTASDDSLGSGKWAAYRVR